MTHPLETALQRDGVLVLDGALATELERRGADLSGGLWSARLLRERPELIAEVHRDYLDAGADVIITSSYQASVAGFVDAGASRDEAAQLIRRSVSLAVDVRDDWVRSHSNRRPLVATSVGPYGAVLADGSEYRGHYGLGHDELVAFHRNRLAVLLDAGVEVLACETIPSLTEARAIIEAMADWPQVTAWVSFSARNGEQVSDGTPAAECAAWLDNHEQVVAVGVNCTAVRHIAPLIGQLSSATDKPIVVYPNSGESWDAEQQRWRGSPSGTGFATLATQWRAAGARMIGGCCRTRPQDVADIARVLHPPTPSLEASHSR
ncbi:MAG TPA: homocysteine S-methyltransferase [Propionibacteriaceae bacterium]|nr:homocysteine S-methyltransferase [Propionibacteriaceae bacterium]